MRCSATFDGSWRCGRVALLVVIAGVLAALVPPVTVSAVAATTGYAASLIPMGTFSDAAAVNPATDTLYIGTGTTLNVINGATASVVGTVAIAGAIESLAVNQATDTVYVVAGAAPAIYVIDGATNTITATIALPIASAGGIAVDSSTNMVYIVSPLTATVTVIDGATNSIVAAVSTGSATRPFDVAVDPSTDTAWVTDENGTVIAIDGATNTIKRSVSLGTGEPFRIALNVSSDMVYVTDIRSSDVAVINGASDTVTTTIPVGSGLTGVAVDQASGTVYASSLAPNLGVTWIIDGATNTIADSVARGGTFLAVDQATGTAYESSSRQDYVWIITPSNVNTDSPVITSGAGAAFFVGTAGSLTAVANALPAASFTESGALPGGVTLSPDGKLAGTPAPGSEGSYPITLTASNGTAPDFHQAFTLAVNQAPAATVAPSATFQVGTPVSFPIQVTGFPAPSVQVSGNLPAGVSLTGSPSSGWQLAGTPARGSGGLYSVSIFVFNSAGSVDPQVTLTVQEAPSITSALKATFRTGTARNFSLTYLGFPAPAFTETGKLPAGVTFSSGGVFSGTPGRQAGGVYPVTITGNNGIGPDATQAFTLTVNQPPAFTSARRASFSAGKRHTFTIRTSGYPAAKLSERGALPRGITFKAGQNGTAVIAGKAPRADKGKTFKVTIYARNGVGSRIHETLTLKIT